MKIYNVQSALLLLSFALDGFGYHLMGFELPFEYSTILIFLLLIIQLVSCTYKNTSFLLFLYAYIIVQTFILNTSNLADLKVWRYFIILVIYSFTLFSFVYYYRLSLDDFVKKYFKLIFYIALFSIMQIAVFILFRVSIIPQNYLTGVATISGGGTSFNPNIFGIFPRNIGLTTEPANFAYILIPGVYLSLAKFVKKEKAFEIPKHYAIVILAAMILTFSLVAYFGIILSVLMLLKENLSKNIRRFTLSLFVVSGLVIGIYKSGVGDKFIDLVQQSNAVSQGDYKANNMTTFAVISNFLIAVDSQSQNHFIGSGLNTHRSNYDKFIFQIFSVDNVLGELNRDGGSSLFIRTLSEFGIPGLLGLIFFFLHFRLTKENGSSKYRLLNEMSLVTIVLFCTRSEHYVSVTFLVFAAIYYFSYRVGLNTGYVNKLSSGKV
ncbi:MAG: hypothetical protein M0P61_04115 [Ignavibacteriaceae bacterium]|nr:hypothetical protein [Ignavibacteriaceae bacterium]